MGAAAAFWARADRVRRQQGELMDRLGFGPETTPSRRVTTGAQARLLAYQAPRPDRPALLAVPAPIKTAYVWDLAPGASVIRRCIAADLQVYLLAWSRPAPGDGDAGLARHVAAIGDGLEAIARETGQVQAFVAGHSLGGTLAAIAASLLPERVRGLIELEGPMCFGAPGRLEAVVRRLPGNAFIVDDDGTVPGTALDACSVYADPLAFALEPWIDAWISAPIPSAARLHARVRRWTLDETPLPRRLVEEVLDALYRRNRFASRDLVLDGRRADPRAITAPIAAVLDRRSRVVPPASIEAYRTHTGSRAVELIEYPGDAGVLLQHVGVLVGRNAHRRVWPAVLAWLERVWHESPA